MGLLAQSKSEKAPKKLKSRVGLAGSPPGGEPAANLATDSPRPRNAGGGAAEGACSASPASEDDDDFAFDAPAPAPVDGASDSGAHAPAKMEVCGSSTASAASTGVDSPREHGRTGGVRVVLLAPPALDLGPVSARLAAKIGGELIDGAAAGGSEEGGGGLQGAVGFVSDLTGDWEEWKRLVAFSSVLAWDEAGAGADGTDAVRLLPGAEFVFGGNLLGARGDGSGLRLARSLLALRRRYPGRVHFLIGARDVPPRPASAAARLAAPHRNALTGARVQVALLRLTSELSAAAIADPHVLTDGSFPYWVGAARPSCRRPVALRRRCARGGGGGR